MIRCALPRLIAAISMLAASSAFAHTLSESHSSWQVSGNTVRVEMIVPELEAKRLSKSGTELPPREEFSRYLGERLSVLSDHKPCERTAGPTPLTAVPGFLRDELEFTCPDDKSLAIESSVFFDIVPSHTNFARVQVGSEDFFEELLTNEHREAEITGGESHGTLQGAGILKFIEMGIMHIFTGIDHMAFMLGLVLISRRVKDLLLVVTGFTLGHSLTLALAVTGVLRPDAQFIDALVALTIVLIGAENVGDSTHRPLPVALGLGGLLFVMAIAKHLGVGITLPTTLLIGGGMFAAGYLSVRRSAARRLACTPGDHAGVRPHSRLWVRRQPAGDALATGATDRTADRLQHRRGDRTARGRAGRVGHRRAAHARPVVPCRGLCSPISPPRC